MQLLSNSKTIITNLLICSGIFFWDIEYNYFKLETLIAILLINSFINNNFLEDLKKVKVFYIIIVQTFLLDLINQDQFLLESYVKLLYLLILELIVIRNLDFISKNLHNIVLSFFIIFISYTFLYLYEPSQHCLGCFSIYRRFYTENSHLGMMAPSIIIFGFFYIISFKKFIFGFLYLVFSFILLNNFSSTFLIGLLGSIFFLSFISYKNLKAKILFRYAILFLSFTLMIFKPEISYILKSKLLPADVEEVVDNKVLSNQGKQVIKKYDISKYWLGLSAEVYLKSVISSYEIFKDNFFGVGFDKYKIYVDNKMFIFRHSLSPKLNNQDASQNFSKGISELGILFFYSFYLIFVFTKSKDVPVELKNFFITLLLIQVFVRGAGYFNGGYLFSFLFIFHYYHSIIKAK